MHKSKSKIWRIGARKSGRMHIWQSEIEQLPQPEGRPWTLADISSLCPHPNCQSVPIGNIYLANWRGHSSCAGSTTNWMLRGLLCINFKETNILFLSYFSQVKCPLFPPFWRCPPTWHAALLKNTSTRTVKVYSMFFISLLLCMEWMDSK